jgi:SAM-dependent methyltransferase
LSSDPSRGDLYDWEQANVIGRSDQDLPFYVELALATGGPVLELASGTGRLTAPLARAGFTVIGVDLDPDMLGVARRRCAGLPVSLVRADMRRFHVARPVPLVVVPYNGLQLLLTADDRRACLAAVAAALAPGGRFAFEVRDFLAGVQTTEVPSEPLLEAPLGDASVTLYAGVVHDLERRVTTYQRRFDIAAADGTVRSVAHDIALYSFADGEVEALLAEAGLTGAAQPAGSAVRWVAGRISDRPDQGG